MAKPEWGIKRTCQSCGARFYDLMKSPIVCPKCETEYDPEAVLKSRRARPVPVADVKKKKPAEAEDAELDDEDDGVEELGEDEEKVVVKDDHWLFETVTVNLEAGSNTLSLAIPPGATTGPNIDRIEVTEAGSGPIPVDDSDDDDALLEDDDDDDADVVVVKKDDDDL